MLNYLKKWSRYSDRMRNPDLYSGWELVTDIPRYEFEAREFKRFLRRVEWFTNTGDDPGCLSYCMELLAKEVKYSTWLETGRGNSKDQFLFPFHKFSDELLNYHNPKKKALVDFAEETVISAPWDARQYGKTRRWPKDREFKYQPQNHGAIYYEGLHLACVYNGSHNAGIGAYQEQGQILAKYYDTTQIFPYIVVTSDLAMTYDLQRMRDSLRARGIDEKKWKKDLQRRIYGTDYRLLLIYELGRKKYCMEHGLSYTKYY